MLLSQHNDSTRSRTEEVLKSKNLDHDSHLVRVKDELASGHRENLSRELAHQREQLRRQAEAEKHDLVSVLQKHKARRAQRDEAIP